MEFYVEPPLAPVTMDESSNRADSRTRVVLLALVVVAVIVILYLYMYKPQNPETFGASRAPDPSALRDSLAAAGWKLYTKTGCVYCKMQKEALGGSYPLHVDCSESSSAQCSDIQAYPTWVNENTGQKLEGYQDQEQLQKMLRS